MMAENDGSALPPNSANGGRQPDQGAIRLFFVDETTGNPVAGVVVSIFADSPQGRSLHVATLETDGAGYAKFWFDRSVTSVSKRLTVTHGASQGAALVGAALVYDIADLLAGNDTHTIRVDASASAPHLGLPAVMLPDIRDLALSPGSIGMIPHLSPNRGLCGQLMPTNMSVRRFQAFRVVADICNPDKFSCKPEIQVVRGRMFEYEIAWHPAGTSLGDLLNTITLAPCEQVNVAVADWMRRETASLASATDVQQQSFQQMDHERLVTETMQSSVHNEGSAWAVGISATASIPIKFVKLDLSAAFGYSHSSSTTSIALNTTNQLSERITQAASFVSSQRTSVVFQTTASEQQTYQTRTLRNNNHCHTLTFFYYQVNRSYGVVTDYKGVRDVFLVRCNNADFDAKRAYDNIDLLKNALLDPALLSCFDELADALFCCNLTPVVKAWLMDSVTITFWVQARPNVNWLSGVLTLTSGTVPFGPIVVIPWTAGGMYTVSIPLSIPVDPKQSVSISISLNPPSWSSWIHFLILNKIEVTGHVIGLNNPITLYSSPAGATIGDAGWRAELKAALPQQTQNPNECIEKSCCIQKLLGHLNSRKRYYNAVLCFNRDPNERVIEWSCCQGDEKLFSFIDQIENTPITIYGDYVVFPVAGSQLVDNPSILPVWKLVTLPTPGVYSEGILGQCNTCETIDPDKFWDWKDSPCSDNAPTVPAAPTPQNGCQTVGPEGRRNQQPDHFLQRPRRSRQRSQRFSIVARIKGRQWER
jgi:hypothetical protein